MVFKLENLAGICIEIVVHDAMDIDDTMMQNVSENENEKERSEK
jgi:hypothetical protein